MRRRLTTAMIVVVAVALVLAGLFTLVLMRRAAVDETRKDLATQAGDLGAQFDGVGIQRLRGLRQALQLQGVDQLVFRSDGTLLTTTPDGVRPEDIDVAALQRGEVVSGARGSLAFAAAPITTPSPVRTRRPGPGSAIVLTRRVDAGLQRAGLWFLLASGIAIAVAAAVADRLSRRITAPLVTAEMTTRRIAGGDLDARAESRGDADPEVASLVRSINAMAANLARSRGLERQFLMSVSHDLRTPLTSIRGFAEAIADGAADDPGLAASVIASESRRLERLVRDLLDLAKLDTRQFSFDLQAIDATAVVRDTAQSFQPAADEAGLQLTIDVPTTAGAVVADADRLSQVIANLVENAIKFAGQQITVSLVDADPVVVTVDDDGPGIAEDEVGRVFERLYQSSRAPARQIGSGLGLAIVAELMTAMGGEARAEPTPGGGARVRISLRRVGGTSSMSSNSKSRSVS